MKIHIPMDDFPLIFPIFQWAPLKLQPHWSLVSQGRRLADANAGTAAEGAGASRTVQRDFEVTPRDKDLGDGGVGGVGGVGVGDGGLKSYRNQIETHRVCPV